MIEHHFSAPIVRAKKPVGSIRDMAMADAGVALMIGNSIRDGAADRAGSAGDAAAAADTRKRPDPGRPATRQRNLLAIGCTKSVAAHRVPTDIALASAGNTRKCPNSSRTSS